VLAGRPGRYCIRLSRVLTSAVGWARLRLARQASVTTPRGRANPVGHATTGQLDCALGGRERDPARVTLMVMQPPCTDDLDMKEGRRDHLPEHILPDAVPGH
jgi:hypothetical protein